MVSVVALLGQRIYLDTNVIIYVMELPKLLTKGQTELLERIDQGDVTPITSELSLLQNA
jgi:predicted nucleic acid-binding protein